MVIIRYGLWPELVWMDSISYFSQYNGAKETASLAQKKDLYIREGKGRRCCWGDVLECRTSHLADKG